MEIGKVGLKVEKIIDIDKVEDRNLKLCRQPQMMGKPLKK